VPPDPAAPAHSFYLGDLSMFVTKMALLVALLANAALFTGLFVFSSLRARGRRE
jgi:hypothetical protein